MVSQFLWVSVSLEWNEVITIILLSRVTYTYKAFRTVLDTQYSIIILSFHSTISFTLLSPDGFELRLTKPSIRDHSYLNSCRPKKKVLFFWCQPYAGGITLTPTRNRESTESQKTHQSSLRCMKRMASGSWADEFWCLFSRRNNKNPPTLPSIHGGNRRPKSLWWRDAETVDSEQ